jgi:hypothetical protein
MEMEVITCRQTISLAGDACYMDLHSHGHQQTDRTNDYLRRAWHHTRGNAGFGAGDTL